MVTSSSESRKSACLTLSARRIQEHLEQFFAAFGAVSQRSVRETEASFRFHAIDDAAAVQRPESDVANEKRDDRGGLANTDFKHKRAGRRKQGGGLLDEASDQIEPIDPAVERHAGLDQHFRR